jgi:hypothetical protein
MDIEEQSGQHFSSGSREVSFLYFYELLISFFAKK